MLIYFNANIGSKALKVLQNFGQVVQSFGFVNISKTWRVDIRQLNSSINILQ
jgi:hypothetical protein